MFDVNKYLQDYELFFKETEKKGLIYPFSSMIASFAPVFVFQGNEFRREIITSADPIHLAKMFVLMRNHVDNGSCINFFGLLSTFTQLSDICDPEYFGIGITKGTHWWNFPPKGSPIIDLADWISKELKSRCTTQAESDLRWNFSKLIKELNISSVTDQRLLIYKIGMKDQIVNS